MFDNPVLAAFAQPELISAMLAKLDNLPRNLRIMEVCGTHTMALFETGLRPQLKERGINLLSGPGCPVCVTAQPDLDYVFAIAGMGDVILCTFGDMLRVPGSTGSLEDMRLGGSDIRVLYSPLDAIDVARENSGLKVVFLSVGFETTVPGIAYSVEQAAIQNLGNYYIFPLNKTVPGALSALAGQADLQLDGFLCPGHVSVVIGANAYLPLAAKHKIPCAIAGFEPVDILQGVVSLVDQALSGEPRVENTYNRVVTDTGNLQAQQQINRIFEPCDANWRGLGVIQQSGLGLNGEYQRFDARKLMPGFSAPAPSPELAKCRCGDVLCGRIEPNQCACFGTSCTPEHPLGACMVSQEGSCRAYFRYYGVK